VFSSQICTIRSNPLPFTSEVRTTGVAAAARAEIAVAFGSMVDSAGRLAEDAARATLAPARMRAAEKNMINGSEGSSIEVQGRAVRSEGRGQATQRMLGTPIFI
jgi:hypothetical protein